MDKTEGVLLVAAKALREARTAAALVAGKSPSPPNATSFVVSASGDLVVVFDDGTTTTAGRVRGQDGVSVTADDVRPLVEESVSASIARAIAALETVMMKRVDDYLAAIPVPKDGVDGQPGVNGKSVDPDQIIDAVVERVVPDLSKRLDEWTAAVPIPKDGKDGKIVDLAETAAALRADLRDDLTKHVDDYLAAIPMPKDGEPGKDGADGQSVDPREIMDAVEQDFLPELAKKVDEFLAAVPVPENGKDGASVTVDDVAPLIEEAAQKAVEALPKPRDGVDGKDGADVMDAMIDREGQLVITFSDGHTKEVGLVAGKDADMDMLAEVIVREIAKIPTPKDGKDGLGFDDLTIEHDGERNVTFTYRKGEDVRQFTAKFPVPIYRELWEAGRQYEKGDTVTWQGGMWSALCDTKAQPGVGNYWRLAAKRGRDGRNTETTKLVPPVKSKDDEPKG